MSWKMIGMARGFGHDERDEFRAGYEAAMREMHEGRERYGERRGSMPDMMGEDYYDDPRGSRYDDDYYGERRGVRGTGPYSRYRR